MKHIAQAMFAIDKGLSMVNNTIANHFDNDYMLWAVVCLPLSVLLGVQWAVAVSGGFLSVEGIGWSMDRDSKFARALLIPLAMTVMGLLGAGIAWAAVCAISGISGAFIYAPSLFWQPLLSVRPAQWQIVAFGALLGLVLNLCQTSIFWNLGCLAQWRSNGIAGGAPRLWYGTI